MHRPISYRAEKETMADNTDSTNDVKVQLQINGKKVGLNPFVQSFICETITGMVKSLRNVDTVETLELQISRNAD